MSASPIARQAVGTQAIPIKRVLVNDPSEMPSHYSQTPGGTMFSTTPGGTKIVYEKIFLMTLRNSPISKTPPTFDIPENLVRGSSSSPKKYNNHYPHQNNQRKHNLPPRVRRDSYNTKKGGSQEEDQFQMDL